MKHTRYHALTAVICILSLLFQVPQVSADSPSISAGGDVTELLLTDADADTEFDYNKYDEKYQNVPFGTEIIELFPESGAHTAVYENKTCAVDDGETPISFRFRLEQEARYIISVEYYTVAGDANNIERELKINGEIPFSEAQLFQFNRIYQDAVTYDDGFEFDDFGNEIRPFQTQTSCYQDLALSSTSSYYTEPFSFYFSAGENTITFSYIRESFAVSKITLKPAESLPSYAEVKKKYEQKGYPNATIYIMQALVDNGYGTRYSSIRQAANTICETDKNVVFVADTSTWGVKLSNDGVHPSTEGYATLTARVKKILQEYVPYDATQGENSGSSDPSKGTNEIPITNESGSDKNPSGVDSPVTSQFSNLLATIGVLCISGGSLWLLRRKKQR